MTKENIIELLNKVIGEINPAADASLDHDRLKNLTLFIDVFDEMHTMIDDIYYRHKDTKYASVKPFVSACKNQLERIGVIE